MGDYQNENLTEATQEEVEEAIEELEDETKVAQE